MNPSAWPRQAFIGAGSNLGDRAAILQGAIDGLRSTAGITAVDVSSVRETAPVGVLDQPSFLNLVAGVETTLGPEALLDRLLAIENQFGRVRRERWGPRTLDLDLLVYEGETRASPRLTLPHPRMLEREFVTVPLREVLELPRFAGAQWSDLRRTIAAIHNARKN